MASDQQLQEQPILNLIGEKASLGPLRHDLLPFYQKWINDFEVTRGLSWGWRPATREAEEAWYERVSKSEKDIVFTVYDRATLHPIGNAGLHDIDHAHQTAEFGIVLGEKEYWSQGYGTEVTALMLDYGFNALGLHNIMLHVMSYNEAGIRAYTRAGFKMAGRLRHAQRLGNRVYDVLLMDCLSTEFQSPVIRRLLP